MAEHSVKIVNEISERCKPYVPLLLDTIEGTLRPWQHLIASPPTVEIQIENRANQPQGYEEVSTCYVAFPTIRPLTYEYGTAKGERQDIELALYRLFQQKVGKEECGWKYWIFSRQWNVGRKFVEWELGFYKERLKDA